MMDFTGYNVLITGATGQLGSGYAKHFINAGAIVTCLGRDQDKLDTLKYQLDENINEQTNKGKQVGICHYIKADVSTAEQAQQCVETVLADAGAPNVIINSIGFAQDEPFIFHTLNDVSATMSANLHSVVNVCEAFIPLMAKNKAGAIVNVSSITGIVGQPMRTLYGASKAAVIAYSKNLALRYAKDNISVNCLAPQVVAGGLAEKMNPMVKASLQSLTPIDRECTLGDLISPTFMLAKQSGQFITGDVIKVTGGLVTW